MLIKEIVLNNFRIYRGENKINITPDGDKNIVVISGQNGFGKTTFLMALVWCLYGRQMERVDEIYHKEIIGKCGSYNRYIGKTLNRDAERNKETSFSVSVTFTDVQVPEITCKEVKIIREYDTLSGEEKLTVLIDNRINELIQELRTEGKQDGEEVFIRDFILPIEIAKFFFFDAEKIVSLADTSTVDERKNLSIAYTQVLGINKYEELKATLESLQDDYRKKSATKEDEQQFNTTDTSIKNHELRISKLSGEIEQLQSEKGEKTSESNELQTRLIREGENMSVEELEKKKAQSEELATKLRSVQDSIKDIFDLIPFGLAGGLMMDVSEQLEQEKAYKDAQRNQENITEKTHKIIQDIEIKKQGFEQVIPTDIRDFYEESIKELIAKYFCSSDKNDGKPIPNPHDFTDSQINEFNTLINNIINNTKHEFSQKNDEYTRTKNELDSIRREIRRAEKDSDDPYIAGLRAKKDGIDDRIHAIDQDIFSKNAEISKIRGDIKTEKQQLEALRQKIDASRQYSAKEKKTQELIDQLKKFIKKFKQEKKEKLEERILNELSILLHKKNFIGSVDVSINQNGDDVDICLYDTYGKKIDRDALSMGERQLYSSALLKSLIDESDIDFPVFIDSPMQKFDKEHATNIIRDYYPNVSNQVVVFPLLHKELNEDEYSLMLPKVSKAFLIQSVGNDASKFLEVQPDHLFNY